MLACLGVLVAGEQNLFMAAVIAGGEVQFAKFTRFTCESGSVARIVGNSLAISLTRSTVIISLGVLYAHVRRRVAIVAFNTSGVGTFSHGRSHKTEEVGEFHFVLSEEFWFWMKAQDSPNPWCDWLTILSYLRDRSLTFRPITLQISSR